MKSKIIINVKKLISVLLCTVLISSALPNTPLNGMVFAAGGNISVDSDITFAKPSNEDKELEVKSDIKNYTITKIVNTSIGNKILTKGKDYEFNSNKITLKNKYLRPLHTGICTLEIYFCNSDTKKQCKVTTKLHIAKFDNLNSQYTVSDKVYEPHRGSHSDFVIYDARKIRLNCGDKIQNEIIYRSSDENVATIDEKTGELKIKNPGKFKAHATREFKKPKDKNCTTLQFESGFIQILKPEEFINGGSSDKNNSNSSPIKLEKKINKPANPPKSTLPAIIPKNKNTNIRKIAPRATIAQSTIKEEIVENKKNIFQQCTSKIGNLFRKIAPRKMAVQPITDENDRNRKADLLKNILGKNEKKRNKILSANLRKWTNNVKELELDENARKIQHAYRNFRKKENQANAVAMLHEVLGRHGKQCALNTLKENDNNKLRRESLLRNIHSNRILLTKLHKWNQKTEGIKQKATKNRIAKWLENKYRVSNDRGKWNNFADKLKSNDKSKNIKGIVDGLKKSVALKNIENVLSRKNNKEVFNALKENDKKNNNNIFADKYTNPIFEIQKKIFQINPNKTQFSLAGNAIISDPDSISIKGLKQSKPSTDTTINNLKSSYNNEGNGTDKIITLRSAKPAVKNKPIEIKPHPVTIENVKIKNKTFDGTNNAEFDGTPTLNGVIDGDDVKLVTGKPTFNSINVGENIPINFTEFSLEGKDAYKYYIKQQPNNIYGNIISRSNYRKNNLTFNSNYIQSNTFPDFNNIKIDKLKLTNSSNLIKNKLNSINPPNNFQLNVNYNSDEIFEAEDSATGIQVSAPKGVFPKSSKLVVKEMQQNTNEYDNAYKNLDDEKKNKIEHIKLYEVCVVDQNNEIIRPNISKGLITVKIPTPNDHDLTNLQIDRIKQNANNNFNENIVNINNRNYCEFQTNHFSPYTMIDEKNINDIMQSILPYLVVFVFILLISLSTIMLKKRKTKKIEK